MFCLTHTFPPFCMFEYNSVSVSEARVNGHLVSPPTRRLLFVVFTLSFTLSLPALSNLLPQNLTLQQLAPHLLDGLVPGIFPRSSLSCSSPTLLFLSPILSLTVSVSAGPCHPRGAGFLAQCLQCPVPKRPWPALVRPVPALRASVQGFIVARLSAGHATSPQL